MLMRPIALAFLITALFTGSASAADLYIKYKLYALGLPIGSGVLSLDVDSKSYSVSANGQTAAFGRLVSDGKGTVEVAGTAQKLDLEPARYALDLKSEDETGTITMRMRKGSIDAIEVRPPQDRMKERVKVTAEHLKSVLDPLTAAVLPAPQGLAKESCNRTLRIFDGKERYDVHLQYKSRKATRTSDGRFKGDMPWQVTYRERCVLRVGVVEITM